MVHNFTFAVFGDVHGWQVDMYRRVANYHRPIDLVLQVGDFETHRDEEDVASKTGPKKYRVLGQFHRLLACGCVPVPTVFIAGNHEAFRWLDGHEDGFELLPGLSYLGRFGVRYFGPLLVAGLSGIYHPEWFDRPRYDGGRFFQERERAKTYLRRHEVEGLVGKLKSRPDVLLLHDWPAGLRPEYPSKGNLPARKLIETIRPRWVFCGHHHFHADGIIPHPDGSATKVVALGIFRGKTPDMAIAEVSYAGIQLVELCRSDNWMDAAASGPGGGVKEERWQATF